jgi:energy-converting hydrogenase Eha subunit G
VSEPTDRPPWRLWDHIGVISGVVLGLIVVGFLVFLAALGDPDALTLIVFLVVGVALVALGGKLHGLQSR